MKWNARARMFIACICLAACFTIFSYRLIFLQVVKHDEYAARAEEKHGDKLIQYARRGVITDVKDEILADNVPVMTVIADGSLITRATVAIAKDAPVSDAAALADLLAKPLAMDRDKLMQMLRTGKPGLLLKKDLAGNAADDLTRQMAAQSLAGIEIKKDSTNAAALADLLSKPLSMDRAKLLETLGSDKAYIVLEKGLPESVANQITDQMRSKSLHGIRFEQDFSRIYPNGSMLCHVIGYMDHTHQGVDGIEKSMNQYLSGHDGFRFTEKARSGKELVMFRGQERAARAGDNVRLTIDMGLQSIVETELDSAIKQFHPKSAVVVLMRPQTGEILALANRPNFDLNDFVDAKPEDMKNHAIMDMVEPGSIFKIVTASAAYNEGVVNKDSMIFCENGHFTYANKVLHDHGGKGFGDITVADILMHSSNIGAAKLAMLMGDEKFYEYIRRFGFGERTGVSLPGEISGLVHPPHQWSKISITRLPMGQGVGVTAIQTVTALSAIANGGHLMMPQIIHDITDESGATVTSYPPVEIRQVISEKVARQMSDDLKRVVSKYGTAPLAAVAGFTNEIAGKTGTAQIPLPGGAGYYDDKYIASFEGFMPADHPAFVALVMIEDPKTGPEQYYGGLVAAPIFSRIAEKAARYLNIEPHPDETPEGVIVTRDRDFRDN